MIDARVFAGRPSELGPLDGTDRMSAAEFEARCLELERWVEAENKRTKPYMGSKCGFCAAPIAAPDLECAACALARREVTSLANHRFSPAQRTRARVDGSGLYVDQVLAERKER